MVILSASGVTRVEQRPLDIVVWVRINPIRGRRRRVQLQVPRTPLLYVSVRLALIERDGER